MNERQYSPNVTQSVTLRNHCSDLVGLAQHAQHHDPRPPEHPAAEVNRLLQDLEYLTSRLRMALIRLTDYPKPTPKSSCCCIIPTTMQEC